MENFQTVRGFRDLNPEFCDKWYKIYSDFKKLAQKYNVREVRTPTLEFTNLFARGVGEGTDIVDKEMFTFNYEDNSLCMKPEGTAPIVRSLINNGIFRGRFFTIDKFFRKERPQKGRYREFYQISVEFIGKSEVYEDIELLNLVIEFFALYNINYKLKINSIGSIEDRGVYIEKLKEYLQNNYDLLSETSKDRFNKNKILRILDSKEDNEVLAKIPCILDYLSEDSLTKFNQIGSFLHINKINYEIDTKLVRGLDYYNDIVFEFIALETDASQSTFCGGGRYDGLFEIFGGQKTSATGCGIGIDRMIDYFEIPQRQQISIGVLNEKENEEYLSIINILRKKDFSVELIKMTNKNLNKARKSFDKIIGIYDNYYFYEDLNSNTYNKYENLNDLINFINNIKMA